MLRPFSLTLFQPTFSPNQIKKPFLKKSFFPVCAFKTNRFFLRQNANNCKIYIQNLEPVLRQIRMSPTRITSGISQLPRHLNKLGSGNIKAKLIQESLLQVHKFGFTNQSILAACSFLDLSSSSVSLLTKGPADLTFFLMEKWNQELEKDFRDYCQNILYHSRGGSLEAQELLDPHKLLFQGLKIRLSYIFPYIERWKEVSNRFFAKGNTQRFEKAEPFKHEQHRKWP
jgi:hypothetical protein